VCILCGFSYSSDSGDHYGEGSNTEYWGQTVATLKKFPLNAAEITLAELGTHIRRHKLSLFALSPEKFEELIADAYRNMGYYTRLTKRSHDGGIDIYVMSTNAEQEIVQCKRYAAHRKVSVSVVREMLGVQLIAGIRRAAIVSTSGFSLESRAAALKVASTTSGFRVDLKDAGELISSIDCYNAKLPPLHLDPRLIEGAKSDGHAGW
jgi:HJR/Mrr/RecB family endonuclease